VLTLHGNNFVRPNNSAKFSSRGDLHQLNLVLPKYFHNHPYQFCVDALDQNKNYSVLIDNGINDESIQFQTKFKNSKIIKICYTDYSWAIVAKTSIIKAAKENLNEALPLGQDWDSSDDWAIREKYFLYLRDHFNRYAWRPSSGGFSLQLDCLLDYKRFKDFLQNIGIEHSEFEHLHSAMLDNNRTYFHSVESAIKIISAIESNDHISVDHVVDLWDQAVVNYFLYLKFGIEVPANTYANWFTNTLEISKIL
jgi:hypothetical protein